MLKDYGFIDEGQLDDALASQRERGGRLGDALLRLHLVTESELLAVLGEQAGVPFIHIRDRVVPRTVVQLLPEKLMRWRHVFPLAVRVEVRPRQLVVATSAPLDLFVLDEVAFAAGMRVKPVLALESDIAQAIDRHCRAVASA